MAPISIRINTIKRMVPKLMTFSLDEEKATESRLRSRSSERKEQSSGNASVPLRAVEFQKLANDVPKRCALAQSARKKPGRSRVP
jgi:hypothetical protein